MATKLSRFESPGDNISEEQCTKHFESFIQSQNSFLTECCTGEDVGQFSAGPTETYPVFQREV